MEANQKNCKSCKEAFIIEPEDFVFYSYIKVPPPTWCVECRFKRRLATRDGRFLFKRKCDAQDHDEMIISIYPKDCPAPVYDQEYWRSDKWGPADYGREYDFNRPFFAQWKDLLYSVPVRNLRHTNCINCDYSPSATDSKNCYQCIGAFGSENCLYSYLPVLSKNCVDCWGVDANEWLYDCFGVDKSFNTSFCVVSEELIDCAFLYDSVGCYDCFLSIGLRNQKYVFKNKKYSKKEYFEKIKEYNLASYQGIRKAKEEFEEMLLRFPRRFCVSKQAEGCTGDDIHKSKNCKYSFNIIDGAENCKYVRVGGKSLKESYDVYGVGLLSNLLYETNAVSRSERIYFCDDLKNCNDIYYSKTCWNSEYLFGCTGLKNKKYCILNKQYTKDEYEGLVPKIITQMNAVPYTDKVGREYRFGEFFPAEINLFGANISALTDYYDLDKDSLEKEGFLYHEMEDHNYSVTLWELPDNIEEVGEDILNEVIGCLDKKSCNHNCVGAFKIIKEELDFYKKRGIALPRYCFNCRYATRLRFNNPYKLYNRQCLCLAENNYSDYKNTREHPHKGRCENVFMTPYALERKELVYCKECYEAEVT